MRESQRKKLIMAGLGKAQKRSNRRKYKCIHPNCKLDSIKSHSQQKKGQLSSIAEDSSVYAMRKNMYQMFNAGMNDLLSKQTIGEASRYKGYCNAHDTSIFSPIENGNLDIDNPEHNFLLLLRAVSYEYASKRDMYDRQKDILSQVEHLFSYEGRKNYEASGYGIKVFLEKDAPYYLSLLFDIYESKNWSKIQYNSFEIEKNIGVSSTTCFSPLREDHPSWMAENFEKPQPFISFSVVPDESKTIVAFVWFAEFADLCGEYSRIDINQEDISNVINTYIFCESEDVCVRPSLWEKIPIPDKNMIYRHMGESDSVSSANKVPLVLDW
ncbi:MAG: hypothetical protein P1U57_07725 [Oleibacter sp.]|nr:hypothetical protein [Thalassolituus sp.]